MSCWSQRPNSLSHPGHCRCKSKNKQCNDQNEKAKMKCLYQVSGHVYVYWGVNFASFYDFSICFFIVPTGGICLSISSAISLSVTGPTWSWSYGSWICNYPSNQCLSPLTLEFEPSSCRGVIYTTLCNAVCQWLGAGLWMTASIWACLQLSKLKYLYHTPIHLWGQISILIYLSFNGLALELKYSNKYTYKRYIEND